MVAPCVCMAPREMLPRSLFRTQYFVRPAGAKPNAFATEPGCENCHMTDSAAASFQAFPQALLVSWHDPWGLETVFRLHLESCSEIFNQNWITDPLFLCSISTCSPPAYSPHQILPGAFLLSLLDNVRWLLFKPRLHHLLSSRQVKWPPGIQFFRNPDAVFLLLSSRDFLESRTRPEDESMPLSSQN